jgi:hypothetical protein
MCSFIRVDDRAPHLGEGDIGRWLRRATVASKKNPVRRERESTSLFASREASIDAEPPIMKSRSELHVVTYGALRSELLQLRLSWVLNYVSHNLGNLVGRPLTCVKCIRSAFHKSRGASHTRRYLEVYQHFAATLLSSRQEISLLERRLVFLETFQLILYTVLSALDELSKQNAYQTPRLYIRLRTGEVRTPALAYIYTCRPGSLVS